MGDGVKDDVSHRLSTVHCVGWEKRVACSSDIEESKSLDYERWDFDFVPWTEQKSGSEIGGQGAACRVTYPASQGYPYLSGLYAVGQL